jgi:hypothetical protein
MEDIISDIEYLPCAHCYHGNCISEWLSTKTTCPICKISVYTTSPEQLLYTDDSQINSLREMEMIFQTYILPNVTPENIQSINNNNSYPSNNTHRSALRINTTNNSIRNDALNLLNVIDRLYYHTNNIDADFNNLDEMPELVNAEFEDHRDLNIIRSINLANEMLANDNDNDVNLNINVNDNVNDVNLNINDNVNDVNLNINDNVNDVNLNINDNDVNPFRHLVYPNYLNNVNDVNLNINDNDVNPFRHLVYPNYLNNTYNNI